MSEKQVKVDAQKVRRVEQQMIRKGSKYKKLYKFFDKLCFISKNHYNTVNYELRQRFIENDGKPESIPSYFDVSTEYRKLNGTQDLIGSSPASCITKSIIDTWTGFKKSVIEFEKNPEKFCSVRGIDKELLTKTNDKGIPLCKPSMPRYLDKEKGRYIFIFEGEGRGFKCVDDKGTYACTNKAINRIYQDATGESVLMLKSYRKEKECDKATLKQIRIVPKPDAYMLEFIYEIILEKEVTYESRYRTKEERAEQAKTETISDKTIAIKMGVNDFVTVVNNFGESPFILSGDSFKPIIDEFIDKKAGLTAIATTLNGVYTTKRIQRLSYKLTRQTKYISNMYSKFIVDWCKEHDVTDVVLVKTKGMKQGLTSKYAGLIPTAICENQIKYKLEEAGINVKDVTSKSTKSTSFLDLEPVETKYENKTRIKDKMFVSNKGIKINSSVNTTYQAMRKRYANSFSEKDMETVKIEPIYYAVVKEGSLKLREM